MKMKELQQQMLELFFSGLTLEEIAYDFGLTADEVYQSIRWLKDIQ